MKRKILIVDDLAGNRRILNRMLSADYDILEAANGFEAESLIRSEGDRISAVLLDISMPGMDGYEVLARMRENPKQADIPVIMITGSEDENARVKALSLGANDFVMKPYSSEIIKHCLRNNISLYESASIISDLQRDKLTKLLNRDAFLKRAEELVKSREAGYYIMAYFDVDKFKVINDQYGMEKGDDLLRHIAVAFKNGFEPNGGICCRITADNFAVLYPSTLMSSTAIEDIRKNAALVEGIIAPIVFNIGRYQIDDTSLSASTMLDRAVMAAETIKGRYDTRIAQYDESMRARLIREQGIVMEMESALKSRQFEVWYQPQINHSTGAQIGAEALVRWRHPEKGLIPPDMFIPVFEKNGFIYELDKFVWEEVCAYLRRRADEGGEPLPVSVNVSRDDIFRTDIIDVLEGLIKKYGLPVALLRLEITETAFAHSVSQIIDVVKTLVERGFTVEIDDFGSGYSSLNTLKDVPAQIIKLDMRFLESSNSERGGNIVESVVRMAKWLGMSVIAEGVETVAQADYLRSIGCSYIQGYLYSRPMPEASYREFCASAAKEGRLSSLKTVKNLNNDSFWDPNSMDTLIFNSYVGGACIYEYHSGKIELLRATEKYAQVIGSADMTVEDALKLKWQDHLDSETDARLVSDIRKSIETGADVTGEYMFLNLPGCPRETYLRATMRVIATSGDRCLVYCTNENITAQRQAEIRERESARQILALSERFKAIMDNIDLGIIAAVLKGDNAEYVFANDRYYTMLGYTKAQFEAEITSPYQTVAPEDKKNVTEQTARLEKIGDSALLEYWALLRNGDRRFFRAAISVGSLSGIDQPVQLSVIRDITEEKALEQSELRSAEQSRSIMRDIDSGLTATVRNGDEVELLFSNEQFYQMRGYTKEQYRTEVKDYYSIIHPDDVEAVKGNTLALYEYGHPVSQEYRAIRRDKSEIWIKSVMSLSHFTGIEQPVVITLYTDITSRRLEQQRLSEVSEQLQSMMDDMPGGYARLRVFPDGSLKPVYINEGYCRIVGLTRDEVMRIHGEDSLAGVHPDDAPLAGLKKTLIYRHICAIRRNREGIRSHLRTVIAPHLKTSPSIEYSASTSLIFNTFPMNDHSSDIIICSLPSYIAPAGIN